MSRCPAREPSGTCVCKFQYGHEGECVFIPRPVFIPHFPRPVSVPADASRRIGWRG